MTKKDNMLRRMLKIGLIPVASGAALLLAGSLLAPGTAFAAQTPAGVGGSFAASAMRSLTAPGTAFAAQTPAGVGGTYEGEAMLLDANNNLCLDGNTSEVFIEACNSGDLHQWWEEYLNSAGTAFMFVDENNGLCLDGNTSEVFIETCNSSDLHQLWGPEDGEEYFLLVDENNGLCLDGNTSRVFIETCNADDLHQNWDPGEF